MVESVYRPSRTEVDSRVKEIKNSKEKPEATPEHKACEKCHGLGETRVVDDDGKVTKALKFCDACEGTGVAA